MRVLSIVNPSRLLRILVLPVMLFGLLGCEQPTSAGIRSGSAWNATVVDHNLNSWNTAYYGFVNSSMHEDWRFQFIASHSFVVTATRISGDLDPLILLLDANGDELERGVNSLTSTQPAGSYSFRIQPQSGTGLYTVTLREIVPGRSSASTVVEPANIGVGENATVTVSLDNVPVGGYTSVEFTCTYNAALAELGNITVTDLFGVDPVIAATTPQNGSFILAIAGSSGRKAATSGAAFTFTVEGLQAGQTTFECIARISQGDDILMGLPANAASLTVLLVKETPTPAFTPVPVTATAPLEAPTPTSTLEEARLDASAPTLAPTSTAATLTGQVLAGKPVTITLLNVDSSVAASVAVAADGTFRLTAPAGTYNVCATAAGFFSVEASVTLTAGDTGRMPPISLLPGDVDSNNVADQFDALQIGVSYNTTAPVAADLNNDGIVNVLDLEVLARNYRKTGPIAWQ